MPVVSIYRDFAYAGGLIGYGPNLDALYRRAAAYVDMLLKGQKANDLPVEQPAEFDLVINLKTAKGLGITIPQAVAAARGRGNSVANRRELIANEWAVMYGATAGHGRKRRSWLRH